MTADRRRLKNLWVQAFGDAPEVPEAFFATAFAPDRFHCVLEDGIPVSALYWLDCTLHGQKLAYIYAAATVPAHRGKGLFRLLMTQTHEILAKNGYAGVILVPGCQELFGLYKKFGYRTATTVSEFTCDWDDSPIPFQEISSDRYAALRKILLPGDAVMQEGKTLDFLQTYCRFFAGDAWVLVADVGKHTLFAQEFLGDPAIAPRILRALNLPSGQFRIPGTDRAFAMFLPLRPDCPVPGYFGMALD